MIFICTHFSTRDKVSARSKQEFVLFYKKNGDIYMFLWFLSFLDILNHARIYSCENDENLIFFGFLLLYSIKLKYLHKLGHPNWKCPF